MKSFLQCTAATVRDLVRTGKAVHVTLSTADELDLLAGLPWGECLRSRVNIPAGTLRAGEVVRLDLSTAPAPSPADLALGWLLASRVRPSRDFAKYGDDMIPVVRVSLESADRSAECAELAVISAELPPNVLSVEVVRDAHRGTREGARAAWTFIAEQCRPVSAGELTTSMQAMHDRYRRELEAM